MTEDREMEPLWSVWRQDDNGHVFAVRSGLTEATALELVRELEGQGHKQTYWAKEDRAGAGHPAGQDGT